MDYGALTTSYRNFRPRLGHLWGGLRRVHSSRLHRVDRLIVSADRSCSLHRLVGWSFYRCAVVPLCRQAIDKYHSLDGCRATQGVFGVVSCLRLAFHFLRARVRHCLFLCVSTALPCLSHRLCPVFPLPSRVYDTAFALCFHCPPVSKTPPLPCDHQVRGTNRGEHAESWPNAPPPRPQASVPRAGWSNHSQ